MSISKLTLLQRFEQKFIKTTDGCWLWTAGVNPWGYARFKSGAKTVRANRFSYEAYIGPIPQGKDLDHTCHDPATCKLGDDCPHRRCVNPDHLEAVTKLENYRRGAGTMPGVIAHAAKKRAQTHCKRGHPFDSANTSVNAAGQRICKTCSRDKMRAWRAKQ